MKIVICHLFDNVSAEASIGAGRTQPEALEDAITNFLDKPPQMIRRRMKERVIVETYYGRNIAISPLRGRR